MTRIVLFALFLGALLTGIAFQEGELPTTPDPTTDAGCEWDPDGRPCQPGS